MQAICMLLGFFVCLHFLFVLPSDVAVADRGGTQRHRSPLFFAPFLKIYKWIRHLEK